MNLDQHQYKNTKPHKYNELLLITDNCLLSGGTYHPIPNAAAFPKLKENIGSFFWFVIRLYFRHHAWQEDKQHRLTLFYSQLEIEAVCWDIIILCVFFFFFSIQMRILQSLSQRELRS